MTPCGCGCCAGTATQTPAQASNPPGLRAVGFRAGQYGAFLSSMRARLSSPAYPALAGLTVRDTDDPAIALLDGWAIAADVLTFYTERLANEGYLRTATSDQSLRLLGRLVGYQPRPGVAADTFLSFTLDKDPSGRDTTATIARGARAQSVPAPGQDAQSFETSTDLLARWSWNDLQVRMRQHIQIEAAQLPHMDEVNLAGTATNLTPGNRLLFVFGTQPGMQAMWVVSQVRIDRAANVTVASQQAAALPTLAEMRAAYRELLADPGIDLAVRATRSRIIRRFADDVLTPLLGDIAQITTPAELAAALDAVLQRLGEAAAIAAPYQSVHDWFVNTLRPALAALREQLTLLEPTTPGGQAPGSPGASWRSFGPSGQLFTALARHIGRDDHTPDPALLGLAALLGSLRRPPSRPPASPAAMARNPAQLYAPGSDVGPRLLATLDPRIRDTLYPAWGKVDITQPAAVQQVQALRIAANPFGATAPLQPVFDAQGKVIGHVEWPLADNQVLDVQLQYDSGWTAPTQAMLSLTSPSGSWPATVDLATATPETIDLDLGPAHVHIVVTPPPIIIGVMAAPAPPPGVTFTFTGNVPNRTVSVPSPADATSPVTVTVQNGGNPLSLALTPGAALAGSHDDLPVSAQRAPAGAALASLDVSLQTPTGLEERNVLTLDASYDGIAPGTWVAVDRPRKGATGPGSIPGDSSLALVFARVTSARVISKADFGITGKVTSLTLEHPWLDGQDTLLSHIRDATVYTAGEPLELATEPITDDVGGDQIELAQAYDGLTPGRWVVVTGERTDIPGTTGLPAAELSMIAAVRQTVDPARPGDTVHAVLVLATALAYTYRRTTVHVYANVVPATQGASRDEAIGSGDASLAGQTFSLFQGPLTWVAARTALGAASTLEVRVDGVLWQEVDSFAGRGPREQVYVTSTGSDGRVRVKFGDGVHGARLPTGTENVRAHYRFGIGSAGNVAADQVTQLTTRPLGVSAVTNPLPAVGGADPDDAAQMRGGIPLSITALDRLVGVPDYADFARARAGIGRASAARLYDGTRQIVHVTVAGAGDIPLTNDSDLVSDLLASLSSFGDPQLPVAVAVREEVLLVIAASVRVDALHSWELVEPQVRGALAARLEFAARDLGQPAYLSEVISAVQGVPGVDYVDVTAFTGVSDTITPADMQDLAAALAAPADVVPASPARFEVKRYAARAGQTLTAIAATVGITVAELLSLNPDITDPAPLPADRSVVVFRGIRPAQLVVLSPAVPETLILTEAPS
jgi:predicted phage baseplate assembly protein